MIHLITRNSSRELDGTIIGYIEFTKFPSGEPHCNLKPSIIQALKDAAWCEVTIPLLNTEHLLELAVLTEVMSRYCSDRRLYLGYVSGGRQDRETSEGEPVTIKAFANIINGLNFREVTIMSPHSDVTPAVINNCRVKEPYRWIEEHVARYASVFDCIGIVSPDAGASKKIQKLYTYLKERFVSTQFVLVQGTKHRDEATGKLSGFSASKSDSSPPVEMYLIVDDICDGGGTFLGLEKVLPQYDINDPAGAVLLVTHGFFSKGRESLQKVFARVDAFFNYDQPGYPNQWIPQPKTK